MEDQFEDLKQFIDSRISQSEASLEKKIKAVDSGLNELKKETRSGFSGVADAFDELHKQISDLDKETDLRLTNLEQKAA